MSLIETEAYWNELLQQCSCHGELDEPLSSLATPSGAGGSTGGYPPPGLSDPFNKIVEEIYRTGQFPLHQYKQRLAQYAQHLWAEAERGYGSKLSLNSADTKYLAQLQRNAWQFAAAKAYNELTLITQQLLNKDGKLRSFDDFKGRAIKISNRHNQVLVTEKETLFRSAQMAKRWQSFTADRQRFPLVEFDALIDDRTTDLCRSLDRIVVPVGHPYLQIYWPPNHFFCRLNVRQLVSGTPTPAHQLPYPVIPENFKTNLAAQGKLLPDSKGYFKDLPPAMLADKQTGWIPPEPLMHEQYTGGGSIQVHERMDKDRGNDLLYLGIKLAENSNKVEMMPEIHSVNQQARNLFYPDIPAGNHSNPDMRINGILADLKTPETWGPEKLKRISKNFHDQGAGIGIIYLKNIDESAEDIIAEAKEYYTKGTHATVKELWIVDKAGRVSKLIRNDL